MIVLGIWKGRPAIFDRTTGKCVVVFLNTARGWSRAIALVKELAL